MRTKYHASRSTQMKAGFERNDRMLDEGNKRFFKLFQESTLEGSQAAAQKMKKIVKRLTKNDQKFLLSLSLQFLVHSSNLEMLSWPNSPLLVMLHFVDPNVLFLGEETRFTPLHHLVELADPFEYSTHQSHLILAKQLIEHGANVNAVSIPTGRTPLHDACSWYNVTNLDFVELLLKKGAGSNAQDHITGLTPLMITTPDAPGAAKFLLNWSTTDVNITIRSGDFFLESVRSTIAEISATLPDSPDRVPSLFLLQQWIEIE